MIFNNTIVYFRLLINKRKLIADDEHCLPYMIASNKAIMEMAKYRPQTLNQMETMNRKYHFKYILFAQKM